MTARKQYESEIARYRQICGESKIFMHLTIHIMADYKVNFKDLKSRVGIDDVAYSLGYRLDRKAGVGRYIELVLGDGANRRDTIIVSNPRNKAAQTFFRRDGSKGDVVTLIRENLDSFFVINGMNGRR